VQDVDGPLVRPPSLKLRRDSLHLLWETPETGLPSRGLRSKRRLAGAPGVPAAARGPAEIRGTRRPSARSEATVARRRDSVKTRRARRGATRRTPRSGGRRAAPSKARTPRRGTRGWRRPLRPDPRCSGDRLGIHQPEIPANSRARRRNPKPAARTRSAGPSRAPPFPSMLGRPQAGEALRKQAIASAPCCSAAGSRAGTAAEHAELHRAGAEPETRPQASRSQLSGEVLPLRRRLAPLLGA